MSRTYAEGQNTLLSLGYTQEPDGGWWKHPDLKDCAHCERPAFASFDAVEFCFQIECSDCFASMEGLDLVVLMEMWNRRACQPPRDAARTEKPPIAEGGGVTASQLIAHLEMGGLIARYYHRPQNVAYLALHTWESGAKTLGVYGWGSALTTGERALAQAVCEPEIWVLVPMIPVESSFSELNEAVIPLLETIAAETARREEGGKDA